MRIFFWLFLLGLDLSAQVFIPFGYYQCLPTQLSDSTNAHFLLGTTSNTTVSGASVQLSAGQVLGTFTSRVFDGLSNCKPGSDWKNFSWTMPMPYGKELPSTSEVAADYSAVPANLMSSAVKLLHMNGTGAIANSASITDSIGSNGIAVNTNGTGMTYTTTAKFNSAITFDGTDDRIDLTGYTQSAVTQYTIAFWMKSNGTGNRVFVQNRGGGAGQSLTIGMGTNPGGCTATNGRVSFGLDTNSIYIGRCMSGGAINDNNWHHVVGTWSGTAGVAVAATQFNIYIDGAVVAMSNRTVGTAPNAPITGLGDTKIARHDSWNVYYAGQIDELGIWTRALTAAEVLHLFQRGAYRIKFQLRSCILSDCSDLPIWKGPDGTSSTFFSELNNNTVPLTGFGNALPGIPMNTFSNFPALSLSSDRYFQYQATFEADNTTVQPSINSATVTRP